MYNEELQIGRPPLRQLGPAVIKIVQRPDGWVFELDANCTVIDIAVLMSAYRGRVMLTAENAIQIVPEAGGPLAPDLDDVRIMLNVGYQRWAPGWQPAKKTG